VKILPIAIIALFLSGLIAIVAIYSSVCIENKDGQRIGVGYYDVCIDGHTYIRYGSQLAIKLYDDGKPIKCSMEELK
jgi:hypothetical protein